MPLSEEEQRAFDQLALDLEQDPTLQRAMTRGPRTPARVVAAVVGVIIGLIVVVVGVSMPHTLVGIAGFVIMAGSALWALLAPRKEAVPPSKSAPASSRGKHHAPRQDKDFMQRMEDRFDRRREQGDL